ncbi:COG4315 family predicted lipoprotein [Oceanisphaera avium]|uniref:Lipoprotein n=1 Tax=Oceanisphaera avium TaxID=1903694 RepID=A0A1Y0D069_9GAMM|nr:hypothetical protein [Oceanisphaera avium]ART80990.1 hypothetical protein CBP12_13175 [Oceanisphaera avium]
MTTSHKVFRQSLLSLGLSVVLSAPLMAAPIQTSDSDEGEILTNDAGMSLYVFDKDEAGVSNCNDKCAENWPPLAASKEDKADGDYDIIKRADDSLQWSYQDQPLYLWKEDKSPGDISGDGKFDVWHLATP